MLAQVTLRPRKTFVKKKVDERGFAVGVVPEEIAQF
jgi:hypothetical protein